MHNDAATISGWDATSRATTIIPVTTDDGSVANDVVAHAVANADDGYEPTVDAADVTDAVIGVDDVVIHGVAADCHDAASAHGLADATSHDR